MSRARTCKLEIEVHFSKRLLLVQSCEKDEFYSEASIVSEKGFKKLLFSLSSLIQIYHA